MSAEDKAHGGVEKNPGREKVQKEIDALRQRLDAIPKVVELDKDVEKARESVVKCLRLKYVAIVFPLLVVWESGLAVGLGTNFGVIVTEHRWIVTRRLTSSRLRRGDLKGSLLSGRLGGTFHKGIKVARCIDRGYGFAFTAPLERY